MSNRFVGLCLALLLVSNIFFLNVVWDGPSFNYTDIIIGKLLNQSTNILLFFYILLKVRFPSNDKKIYVIFLILLLDYASEFFNLFYPKIPNSAIIDSLFVTLQRLTLVFIFVKMDGKIFSKSTTNNAFNLFFGFLLLLFFFWGFKSPINFKFLTSVLAVVVLFVMVAVGVNTKSTLIHALSVAALLICLGDLAFIYSGFNGDVFWTYLYLLPRIFLNIGLLLIVNNILGRAKQKSVAKLEF